MKTVFKKYLLSLLCLFSMTPLVISMEPETINITELIKKNAAKSVESYLQNLKAVAQSYLLFFDWNERVQKTFIPSITKMQELLPYLTTKKTDLFAGIGYDAHKNATLIDKNGQNGTNLNVICEGSKLIQTDKPIPAQKGPALIYQCNNVSYVAIIDPECRAALFHRWHVLKKITQLMLTDTDYAYITNLQNHSLDGIKTIGRSLEAMVLCNTAVSILGEYLINKDPNSFCQILKSSHEITSSREMLNPCFLYARYSQFMFEISKILMSHYTELKKSYVLHLSAHDIEQIIAVNKSLELKQLHDANTPLKNAYASIIATLNTEIANRKKVQYYPYSKFSAGSRYENIPFPVTLCSLRGYLKELHQQAAAKTPNNSANAQPKKQNKKNNTQKTVKSTQQKNNTQKKQHNHVPLKNNTNQELHQEPALSSAPTPDTALVPKSTKPAPHYAQRVTRWFDGDTYDQEVQHANAQSMLYHSFPLIADAYIFSLGIQTPWQNQTKPMQIDTNYSLGGEILYPNGKSEMVLFTCCKDIHDVCYHRGITLKKGNSLFDEYFKHSKWEIDFPPLNDDLIEEKSTHMHMSEHDVSLIEENDFCVRIADHKNNVTIILYKPYQG